MPRRTIVGNVDNDNDENREENREEHYLDDYDGFKLMVREIFRFNDEYRSFTTDKTYTNLIGQTASGLLKDAAAKTAQLSADKAKQHLYAQNVFAAFCMHFCVTTIRARFRDIDLTRAGDVVSTVYKRILARIRRDLEEKGESRYVRNLIRRSSYNAMLDLFDREDRDPNIDDWRSKDSKDTNEMLDDIPANVLDEMFSEAAEAMGKERRLNILVRALAQAGKKGVLSKDELFAICSYFGVGDGYKKLKNKEIAKKLGCSDSRVTKLRENGLENLRQYIRDTPELREEFL